MRAIAESKEARFMIVTTDGWWNCPAGATYQEFVETLQNKDFLVLDVPSVPGFEAGELLIPDDGHWNGLSHAFVADKIEEFIERNQLLSQPQTQGNKSWFCGQLAHSI
jgi:hypothetical protein